MSVNMKVNIAGVEWNNPVTVASGTFGSGIEFEEFVDLNKLGAVTTKGGCQCAMDRKSYSTSCRNLWWNDERSRTSESGN